MHPEGISQANVGKSAKYADGMAEQRRGFAILGGHTISKSDNFKLERSTKYPLGCPASTPSRVHSSIGVRTHPL